jgi:hypothetical protein
MGLALSTMLRLEQGAASGDRSTMATNKNMVMILASGENPSA